MRRQVEGWRCLCARCPRLPHSPSIGLRAGVAIAHAARGFLSVDARDPESRHSLPCHGGGSLEIVWGWFGDRLGIIWGSPGTRLGHLEVLWSRFGIVLDRLGVVSSKCGVLCFPRTDPVAASQLGTLEVLWSRLGIVWDRLGVVSSKYCVLWFPRTGW